jgi:hypothetical protein
MCISSFALCDGGSDERQRRVDSFVARPFDGKSSTIRGMAPKDLLGKRVDILDKGWIELQDVLGDDLAIVNAGVVPGRKQGG